MTLGAGTGGYLSAPAFADSSQAESRSAGAAAFSHGEDGGDGSDAGIEGEGVEMVRGAEPAEGSPGVVRQFRPFSEPPEPVLLLPSPRPSSIPISTPRATEGAERSERSSKASKEQTSVGGLTAIVAKAENELGAVNYV